MMTTAVSTFGFRISIFVIRDSESIKLSYESQTYSIFFFFIQIFSLAGFFFARFKSSRIYLSARVFLTFRRLDVVVESGNDHQV